MGPICFTESFVACTEEGAIEMMLTVRPGLRPLVLQCSKDEAWSLVKKVQVLVLGERRGQ